jgi:hypothetical protein
MPLTPADLPDIAPLSKPASKPGERRRVAVLLRSHLKHSQKALQLARQLSSVTGWDFHFAVDETNGPIDVASFSKVAHTLQSCQAMGLFTGRPRAMSYFGDYPFYATITQIPDYDFYLMIEYDVALAEGSSDYFHRLAGMLISHELADLDFLGTNHRPLNPERRQRPHRFERSFKSIFPIAGLSRRAIRHLYEKRLEEATLPALSDGQHHVYCEVFVPSTLEAAGRFRCLPLNAVIPNSVDRASFNTRDSRVLHHESRLPITAELLHPVLDFPQYLRKSAAIAVKGRQIPAFLRELDFFRIQGFGGEAFDQIYVKLQRIEGLSLGEQPAAKVQVPEPATA